MRGRSVGETLADGKYRIVEFLVGPAYRGFYIACLNERPDELYLASVVFAPKGLPIEQLQSELGFTHPGIFELSFIGQFDRRGEDPERHAWQEQDWVMLEKLPRGTWLPRMLSKGADPATAIQLGISIGEILLRIPGEQLGQLHGLRPECIWAEPRGERWVAMGLSCRYSRFFLHQSRNVTDMLFRRTYGPTDWTRDGETLPYVLAYTLATMIAEWVNGGVVFPDDCSNLDDAPILRGSDLLLPGFPQDLAQVLRGAFRKQSERIPLAVLIAELKALPARI